MPSGIIAVRAADEPEHTLLIADALATSVVLAHDEKKVATVFGVIQRYCPGTWRNMAARPAAVVAILKHIGNGAYWFNIAFPGLVAVAEKPDVLWERPSLEPRFTPGTLHEYELKERADVFDPQAHGDSPIRRRHSPTLSIPSGRCGWN